MLSETLSHKITDAVIMRHLRELQKKELRPSLKHPLYNSILRLLRYTGTPFQSINQSMIICGGNMSGIMFKPDETRCKVFVQKKPYSFDFEVDNSVATLLSKMAAHKIITTGQWFNFIMQLTK